MLIYFFSNDGIQKFVKNVKWNESHYYWGEEKNVLIKDELVLF